MRLYRHTEMFHKQPIKSSFSNIVRATVQLQGYLDGTFRITFIEKPGFQLQQGFQLPKDIYLNVSLNLNIVWVEIDRHI